MYCTLHVLYILYMVHTVHVPCFPCLSDVEASSSTFFKAKEHESSRNHRVGQDSRTKRQRTTQKNSQSQCHKDPTGRPRSGVTTLTRSRGSGCCRGSSIQIRKTGGCGAPTVTDKKKATPLNFVFFKNIILMITNLAIVLL